MQFKKGWFLEFHFPHFYLYLDILFGVCLEDALQVLFRIQNYNGVQNHNLAKICFKKHVCNGTFITLVGERCWSDWPLGCSHNLWGWVVSLHPLWWRKVGLLLGWGWSPELKHTWPRFSLQAFRPIVIHVRRLLSPLQPPVDFDPALLPGLQSKTKRSTTEISQSVQVYSIQKNVAQKTRTIISL